MYIFVFNLFFNISWLSISIPTFFVLSGFKTFIMKMVFKTAKQRLSTEAHFERRLSTKLLGTD